MGFVVEYNWVLKLSRLDSPLLVGGEYSFEKKGTRIYPLNMPIDLLDKDWEAVGSCIITELSYHDNITTGKIKLLELYSGDKKEIMTEYWKKFARKN